MTTRAKEHEVDYILKQVDYYENSRDPALALEELDNGQPIQDSQAAVEMTCSTFKTPARIIE